jgi:predicted dehydrogenase
MEKPMGIRLPELKKAYSAAKASKQIVQIGTQHLSAGTYQPVAQFVRSGRLGIISRVHHEGCWNGPRWRPVPAVKQIQPQDTDWKAWLAGHDDRPFDPSLYFEFRLYQEFSNGIADQWLTHALAGVHHVMDDYFPANVVANGGVFIYKDGRENPDTFQATFVYPKGWMYSYAAMFGNDQNDAPGGFTQFYGQNGTIEGNREAGYVVTGQGGGDRPERILERIELGKTAAMNHIQNWLDSMRSRKTPNADIRSGYASSVASIMAQQSYISGKRLYWDARKEEIADQPV